MRVLNTRTYGEAVIHMRSIKTLLQISFSKKKKKKKKKNTCRSFFLNKVDFLRERYRATGSVYSPISCNL